MSDLRRAQKDGTRRQGGAQQTRSTEKGRQAVAEASGIGETKAVSPSAEDSVAGAKPEAAAQLGSSTKGSAKKRERLERAKDVASIIQAYATTGALLAAGGWFLMQGQDKPRLKLEHRVNHRAINKDEKLLIVDVMLSNVGNTRVQLSCGKIKIYEIIPDQRVLISPESGCNAGQRTLEPGEGDQVHEEYRVSADVSTVRVYTFFANPRKSDIGWDLTSFYDLQERLSAEPMPYTDATPHR